ncbi:hypothetical protein HOY82DRAFT_536485 [Tuber indicum]|nr:hypothetical protein HOY82DRAFT_536485 [Tuber indicum]
MSTLCNSDYSDCYRWRPVTIEVKNGSSVEGSTLSYYGGQRNSGHIPAIRSPKKRLLPKTPTPPVTPKPHPTAPKPAYNPDKGSADFIQHPAAIPANGNHLFPDIMSAKLKEVPAPQSGLPLGRWLPLEERNEGTHRSGKIAGHLLTN